MGSSESKQKFPKQLTYKICIQCSNFGHFGTAIEFIDLKKDNTIEYEKDCGGVMFFKCKNGHIFTYYSNYLHCKEILNNIERNKLIEENERLKLRISELEKITECNNLPSAPPLIEAQIVEK